MNPYITYPLIILVVIGSFNYLYEFEGATSIDLTYEGIQNQTLIGNQTLTGEESELELEEGSLSLDFTMTTGIVAIIISAIALGLIGIHILGSGLSDFSVKIIWNGIVFYGLWTIFSVLALTAIIAIPIFGVLLWFFLTLFYSLGVFGKMGSD